MPSTKEPAVKLVEYYSQHYYKVEVEGEKPLYLPSPTTKLQILAKPFLAQWRGDLGNREADLRIFESQQSGIRIHHAFYTLLMGGMVVYNPVHHPLYTQDDIKKLGDAVLGEVVQMRYQDEFLDVLKLHKWMELVLPEVVAAEKTVYSLKFKEAGTLDVLFRIRAGEYQVNGKKPLVIEKTGLYITDLKTGNTVDKNADWQTSCYANCYEEMTNEEVTGTIILHTGSKIRTGIPGLSTLLRTRDEWKKDFAGFRLRAAVWEDENADTQPETYDFPSLLKLKLS